LAARESASTTARTRSSWGAARPSQGPPFWPRLRPVMSCLQLAMLQLRTRLRPDRPVRIPGLSRNHLGPPMPGTLSKTTRGPLPQGRLRTRTTWTRPSNSAWVAAAAHATVRAVRRPEGRGPSAAALPCGPVAAAVRGGPGVGAERSRAMQGSEFQSLVPKSNIVTSEGTAPRAR
jgi:hypothetical protein